MRFCTGAGWGGCRMGRPTRRFVWGAVWGTRPRTDTVEKSGRSTRGAALCFLGRCVPCAGRSGAALFGVVPCAGRSRRFFGAAGCGALWGPSVAQCFVWRERCGAPGLGRTRWKSRAGALVVRRFVFWGGVCPVRVARGAFLGRRGAVPGLLFIRPPRPWCACAC